MNYQIVHRKKLTDDHMAVQCTACGVMIPFRAKYVVIEKREGSRITNTAFCQECYRLIEGRKKDDRH